MQELISLVEDHKWWRNGLRTNTSGNPEHCRTDKNGRKWLIYKYAPWSNTVKAGPILEHVQKTSPWATAVSGKPNSHGRVRQPIPLRVLGAVLA